MTQYLWLIPVLPLLAAAVSAFLGKSQWRLSAGLAVGSMAASCLVALGAFTTSLQLEGNAKQVVRLGEWVSLSASKSTDLSLSSNASSATSSISASAAGQGPIVLSLLLDPLSAAMALMVTFIGTLIFIYSIGYMAHDENRGRFFCFLALFASAMLGLIVSNNLLMLFMCWELVGLASYLLIGFWFQKPSAAAAAKKAFMTTRIGDIGFLLGMLWLYHHTGTLSFYDNGNGCLEQSALSRLVAATTLGGMSISTAISLLLFCGAAGKSGQLPLHVWLPDAMEGPTPVSALIHAATMVAAGVFLMARVYPLLDADAANLPGLSTSLTVIAWVGALTALFAACVAVAQNDIKRILAYSTVSQLGYMFLGLATGGVAVGMLHLLTHAFFKALLFLGAGSVIHGCHHEQDIRNMGGLRKLMPTTFKTYAIGMMALAGVPLVFSGFWSKDEILHGALQWPVSRIPFYIGLAGAFLTAFYMSRQMAFVFFGTYRGQSHDHSHGHAPQGTHSKANEVHESPSVMTSPLVILAAFAVFLSLFATPAWPWIESYLAGHHAHFSLKAVFNWQTIGLLSLSSCVVFAGIGSGAFLYGIVADPGPDNLDPIEASFPQLHRVLANKFYFDELYRATIGKASEALAHGVDWFDRNVLSTVVELIPLVATGLAWISKVTDEFLVNPSFDGVCRRLAAAGKGLSSLHSGQIHQYLAALAMAVVALSMLLAWISQ